MITDEELRYFKKNIFGYRAHNNQRTNEKWVIKNQGEAILEYVKDGKLSHKTSEVRISFLKGFAYSVKKDFKDVTSEDIRKFLREKEKRGMRQISLNNLKSDLRVFFKWLYGMKERSKYPEVVSWIEVKPTEIPELLEEDLITWEETRNILISGCHNFRDKCLIAFMRETGARINELLNMNIGDIRMESDRAFVKILNSKRKRGDPTYRESVLIDSFYYLQQWLRDHPLRNNFDKKKDIPLFVQMKNKRLTYARVFYMLRKLKKETNFNKPLRPHLFRHSQANDMAKILTDAELRVFGGWTKESNMVARYTHLTSDDVNRKRLEAIGRVKPEEKQITQKEELKPCPRCNEMIDFNKFRFCGKCGMSLQKEEEVRENIKLERLNSKVEELFKIFKEKEKKKILKKLGKK